MAEGGGGGGERETLDQVLDWAEGRGKKKDWNGFNSAAEVRESNLLELCLNTENHKSSERECVSRQG